MPKTNAGHVSTAVNAATPIGRAGVLVGVTAQYMEMNNDALADV
jgi:hypothetical protein